MRNSILLFLLCLFSNVSYSQNKAQYTLGFIQELDSNKSVIKPLNNSTYRALAFQSATRMYLIIKEGGHKLIPENIEYKLISYPYKLDPIEVVCKGFDIPSYEYTNQHSNTKRNRASLINFAALHPPSRIVISITNYTINGNIHYLDDSEQKDAIFEFQLK